MQLSLSGYHQLVPGSAFGMTDVGTVRVSNEDNFLIDVKTSMIAISDGMGGHDGGEIASTNALIGMAEYMRAHLAKENLNQMLHTDPDATWSDQSMSQILALYNAVESVNNSLYEKNKADKYTEGSGIGTTLTGLWHDLKQNILISFHVGDSRLYRYRDNELIILTRDHTLYQQAIENGAIDNLPPRNLLLQAIGPSASIAPDIQTHKYQSGDLFLLCTDGLHGAAPHALMTQALSRADSLGLEQTCATLIALAKQHGSRDNITALLLLCP